MSGSTKTISETVTTGTKTIFSTQLSNVVSTILPSLLPMVKLRPRQDLSSQFYRIKMLAIAANRLLLFTIEIPVSANAPTSATVQNLMLGEMIYVDATAQTTADVGQINTSIGEAAVASVPRNIVLWLLSKTLILVNAYEHAEMLLLVL